MGRNSGKVFKRVKKNRISRINEGKKIISHILDTSSSSKKIKVGISNQASSKGTSNSGFRLIDLDILANAINSNCACATCGAKCLKLSEDENQSSGVVCTLHIVCEKCKTDCSFMTSSSNSWIYDANMRLCYGMRCIGVGREGTNLLCGIMNMPSPVSRYTDLNAKLLNVLESVCKENLVTAVEEAVAASSFEIDRPTNSTDLAVSCDGTWMKRGHTSQYGVDTGKVLDLQVMSKYCAACSIRRKSEDPVEEEAFQTAHKLVCCRNYSGSSGGMEAAGMKLIFHRSLTKYGVRYTKYLGDGDSSAFKTVLESQPYGPDCNIEKLECVGHIQKRMGGRLLKLKKEMRGKKLADGKTLGGQGRLTDKEIHNLQIYYGKAIRGNKGNVKKMQQAVWATYYHKVSTDDNPHHGLCDVSWCGYKKSQIDGSHYHHKHSLPKEVMDVVRPTYKFLADPDLLKKCTHGKTQNPNESFNRLIWIRCPKTAFVSSDVVKIGAYDACLVFNSGNIGRIKVLQGLGIEVGAFTLKILKSIDDKRINRSNSAMDNFQQKARQARQLKRKAVEEIEEDENYGYGQH